MKHNTKIIVLSALALLTAGASLNFAVTPRLLAAGKGSIKGHVSDSAGNPSVGCPIDIFAPANPGAGAGGSAGAHRSTGFDGQPSPSMLQSKNQVLMSLVTDAKGDFEVKEIDAGSYRYLAGTHATGYGPGKVLVKAGEQATVAIKLNPAPGK